MSYLQQYWTQTNWAIVKVQFKYFERLTVRKGLRLLAKQALSLDFNNILDVGTGDGSVARLFLDAGKEVTVTGFNMDSYLTSPLPSRIKCYDGLDICVMKEFANDSFDAIWCSHVLEHVLNPGDALSEMWRILKPNGLLFIIVPEYNSYLVGGHVSTGWNLGSLMYILVLSGFNVRDGQFINHCWNVTAFVTKSKLPEMRLRYDAGDIEKLESFFPPSFNVHQGVNGDVLEINWIWQNSIRKEAKKEFNKVYYRRKVIDWVPPVVMNNYRKLKSRKRSSYLKSLESTDNRLGKRH